MRKNILIIGPIPPKYGGKDFGGIATHIQGLTEELVKKGYKITIWNYKFQKEQYFNSRNIHIVGNDFINYFNLILCGFKVLLIKRNFLSFVENVLLEYKALRLREIFKSKRIDVVHVNSLHETTPLAIRRILKNPIRIISTDHGFWQSSNFIFQQKKHFSKLKNIVECVDKIIYISDYAYEKHLRYDFNQLGKLIKIQNPISISNMGLNLAKRSGKKVIFFNGLSESIKRKRLDLVLNAIENNNFLKNNVKVIAITNSRGMEFINQNVFSFEIEVYGPIAMEKVSSLYNNSDLMVLPSNSESFGLVYMEALMRGIPVIGFDKVITEFQKQIGVYIGEGFSADNNSHSELAIKIEKVLKKVIVSEEIIKETKNLFLWENKVAEFEKIYFNKSNV